MSGLSNALVMARTRCVVHILMMVLGLLRSVSSGHIDCLGEFAPCKSGDVCSMSSECGPCTKGQYLCPSDQQSCVDSAASYERCPRLNGTHLDHRLGIEQRIDYILAHTTLTEQIGQLTNNAPALTRLGIPSYNWLNDDLHGVGRTSKRATILPNGCGLAATWSTELLHAAGRVLGEEARGIHQEFLAGSDRGQHGNGKGITVYGPNLNLVRDPRWGRAQVSAKPSPPTPLAPCIRSLQESFGEDPFLTARLGVAFVTGAQANPPHQTVGESGSLLVGMCCKHFAAYDVEDLPTPRYRFDANVSRQMLWETYLPAFEACVKEAKASHVMVRTAPGP